MISVVRSSHFPYLPVHVRIGNLQLPDYELDLEVLVDTGFDGGLVVPMDLVPDRVPVAGETNCELADGSSFRARSYRGFVSIGSLPPIPTVIMAFPDRALLGRAVTNRYRLSFVYGRQVILES